MKNTIFSLAIMLLLTGCYNDFSHDGSTPEEEAHKEVSVQFNVSQILETKSSFPQGENDITDFTIAAYKDGKLYTQLTTSNISEVSLNLISGYAYDIYALANTDNCSKVSIIPSEFQDAGNSYLFPCTLEDDMTQLYYSYDSFESFSNMYSAEISGFPMKCVLRDVRVHQDMDPITLTMERFIARINFKFDTSSLPGLKVTSVRLKQTPLGFTPFPELNDVGDEIGLGEINVVDGDYATASDLNNLNNGGTAIFYMLANPCGVLLPNNTDEWQKVPTDLQPLDYCSYLEVAAKFDGTTNLHGNVTYRFYLGHDNITDFNVFRNDDITVTLFATRDGLSHTSWKIDASNVSSEPLSFVLKAPKYIAQKGTLDMTSVPNGFSVSLSPTSIVLSNDNVSIAQTSPGHYSISGLKASNNTLYLKATGYATQTSTFEVKGPELKFEKSNYNLTIDGAAVNAIAHYYDRQGNILQTSAFDASLYNQLLAFSYSIDTQHDEGFSSYPVGNSGNSYFVQRLYGYSSNTTYNAIDDFFDSSSLISATATPAVSYKLNSNDSSPFYHANAPIVVLNPFPTASSTLGRIDNTSFVAGGIVSGSVLNVNLTTQANNIGWTIEEDTPTINSDFTSDKRGFNISSDGSKLNFTCRGTAFITQTVSGNRTFNMYHYPCGHCKVKGSLTNSHSNQSWTSPDYYVNIYEHVQLFGQIYGVRWVADYHSFDGAYAYMEVRGEFSPANWSLASNRPAIGNYIWSNKNGTFVDPQGGYCFVGFPATQAAVNFKDGENKGLYALFNYDAQGRFGNTTDNGETSGNLDFRPGSSASDASILTYSWTAAQRDQYMSTHIPEVYMDTYLNGDHTSDPQKTPFPYEVKVSNVTQYVIVDVVNVRQMGSYNSARTWMSPVDYETITVQ
jgi:hypothetical protein